MEWSHIEIPLPLHHAIVLPGVVRQFNANPDACGKMGFAIISYYAGTAIV
jgi:hypothetical protein